MDIRLKIKEFLDKSSVSIRQLSDKSGVRRQSIMRFFSGGNLHINNLEKILNALGYEIELRRLDSEDRHKNIFMDRLSISSNRIRNFCRNNGIEYLALFGSVLGDDFRSDSDIDVLIRLKKDVDFFKLMKIEDSIKSLFKTAHKIDLVTTNSISPLIREEIENDLEVLYEEAA